MPDNNRTIENTTNLYVLKCLFGIRTSSIITKSRICVLLHIFRVQIQQGICNSLYHT